MDREWVKEMRGLFRQEATVTVASGRLISLVDLRQHYTYESLLVGLPTKELNQGTIELDQEQWRFALVWRSVRKTAKWVPPRPPSARWRVG
jgi:hypothetical protein